MNKKLYLIPILFLALILSSVSVHADEAFTGWSGYSNWAVVTANSNYGIIFTSDGGGMNQSIINVTTNHAGSTFSQYRVYINGNTGYIPQRPCGSTVENGVYRTCIFDIPANFTTEVVNMSITLTHTASWTFGYWSPTFPYNDVGPFNIITSWNNGNNGPRYDEAYPFYSIGYTNMTTDTPSVGANFSITAYNSTTTSQLLSYTASINGSTYNSDGGGIINTTLATSNGGIYTLDIDAFGFYNYTEDVNISTNWRANLTQFSLTYLNQSPINDTQYNYTSIEFSVEVEYNGTPISTNCNLILNNASAGSESSGVTNGTFSPSISTIASDGINYYYWSCVNDYLNLTTAPRLFYVDTTFPSITTNFLNNSVYYLRNITASFNFTDDQALFMYNVSIDGVTKGIRYNNGTSNNDTYNLNENPQWLGIGQHTLTAIIADGHIGELNIRQATYSFYVINATEQHTASLIETQLTNYNLTINKTNSNFVSSATFYYNGESKSVEKTSNGIYDYYQTSFNIPYVSGISVTSNWSWNINVNSSVNQIYEDFNGTQTIQQIYLTNCTPATGVNVSGLNFSTYIEATTTRLNTNITLLLTAWYNEKSLAKAFNFTYKDVNNFSICSNVNELINLDYEIEVSSGGYYTRRYNEPSKAINKTPQFMNLYLLPTTALDVVTKLIDQLNSPLNNLTITMERFDFPTSSHQTVQSEKSDINGNSLFYYDANTKYRFLIYNTTGGLIFNTGDMVITQDPTIIQITEGLLNDLMDKPISAWQIKSNLYNISTMIYFEWFTLNGYGTICMNVTYSNVTAWETINSECSSAESGTMTYNFSAYNNGTIKAITYAVGSTNIIGALDIALGYVQKFFEVVTKDNYILYLFLILAGVLLGLSNIVVIPWIIGVIHILCWMIGIIPVSFGLAGVPFIIALILIMMRLK